jgi:hypothetical protein
MADDLVTRLERNYVSFCARRERTLAEEVDVLWRRIGQSPLDAWCYDDFGGQRIVRRSTSEDGVTAYLPLDARGAVDRLAQRHYPHPRPDRQLRFQLAMLLAQALFAAHLKSTPGWSVEPDEDCIFYVCRNNVAQKEHSLH